MKTLRLLILGIGFIIGLSSQVSAQTGVTSVNYKLEYDTTTCLYDCYIIVNSGSATTEQQRLQFNSQYSIVVPTGTVLSIDTTYAPIYNDADGDGETDDAFGAQGPNSWSISNNVNDPNGNGYDYYGITPDLSTQSHYQALVAGNKVKLFSISIDTVFNCGADIKLFENGVDPSSSDAGMNGSDFSQGFTLGGPWQDYNTNSQQLYPPKPLLVSADAGCGNGIEIDLTAETSLCQGPLTYYWTNPAGDSIAVTEDIAIDTATTADNGNYKVVVTDAFGCKDSVTVTATSKPNAGPDQTVCAGTSTTISGTEPTTGTWSAMVGNPSAVDLSPLGGGQYDVTFDNTDAAGAYYFLYSIPGCSDTMIINLNAKPVVSLDDNRICANATAQASPVGAGTWVSNNPLVATIDAATGVITGVSAGNVNFTYTVTATGCSATTANLTVDPAPTVTNTGLDTICVDATTNMTPSTGGTWVSSNPAIVTITNTGLVTGISEGTASVTFTEAVSGCSSAAYDIVVRAKPTVTVGADSICINSTMQLTPSTGGTWTSSDPFIATVENDGTVTGINAGQVVFYFTDNATLCVSEASDTVTVVEELLVDINGDGILCIDETTTLEPQLGGTWTSNNPLVATVLNGVVTAVGQGTATFTYVDSILGCEATTGSLVVDPRPTATVDADSICIGTTTELNTSVAGSWSAVYPLIGTVSGSTVTGVAQGDAAFIFTSSITGCTSDTVFVNVEPGPTVSYTGPTTICDGETTTISPSSGGTWTSSDPTIATIDNFGNITAVDAGIVTFTYKDNSTQCESDPSGPLTVLARPVVAFTGDTDLCIGETSSVTPTTGGTWTSTNPTVATIANDGTITTLQAGFASFYFTADGTGCVSEITAPINVYDDPEVTLEGPSDICVDGTTNVSADVAGAWASSDEGIVTVTSGGTVTGVAPGTTTVYFTAALTDCTSEGITVTVLPTPTSEITDTELCIGETTSLSTDGGSGVWVSSNPSVATVSGSTVTAISGGSVTFHFEADGASCASPATEVLTVHPDPTVLILGDREVCIGETAQATPATGGTWISNDPTIATIDANTGEITGVAPGTTTFVFTNTTTGCVSAETALFEVLPNPEIFLNGDDEICVGNETYMTPSLGGSWSSSDPSIATIENDGTVTAVSPGKVVFTYISSDSGCSSAPSDSITVTPGPTVSIAGDDELCIGETSQLTPASGGTWTSSDPSVATVSNIGVVQAVGGGSATFTFTSTTTGCSSEPTDPIVVHNPPTVLINGTDVICITGTTQMLPSSGGTWVSNNPGVATIDNSGLVTGVSQGTATFTFTSSATGCPSPASDPVEVSPAPNAEITGETNICVGGTTTLAPTAGGVWTSSDPSIASVTNDGVVTSHAPGVVTFTFAESATGCESASATDPLTITNCMNPDFNATYVDVPVDGDVSTNDPAAGSATYGPTPVLVSNPSGSVATISLNGDGTYTFEADMVGVYVYNVPVCVAPKTSGCPTARLVITVVDYTLPDLEPIANVDLATTPMNTLVVINTLENDKCAVTTGCTLDPATVDFVKNASNGTNAVNASTGRISYTPNPGFVGRDTIRYEVCVTGEPTNCAEANQIIVVNSASTSNVTIASDDFNVTDQEVAVTGNVSDNDMDPEGDNQSVTPVSYSVAAGDIDILSDGSYTFTPANGFYGPVEFIYETTDDNASPVSVNATLHLLVIRDLTVQVRLYLEGALINNANAQGSTHSRPLMRDQLRTSPFTGSNYIPEEDPYTTNAYKVPTIDDYYTHVGPGLVTELTTVSDAGTIFGVTGEDAVVDWVFVELRSKSDSTTVLATRAGLVQRDGDVIDVDGDLGLRFPGVAADDYYVSVRHRNHFGAMTAASKTPAQLFDLIDFTQVSTGIYDMGTECKGIYDYTGLAQNPYIKTGYLALWGGDFNGDGLIKFINPNDDLNTLVGNVFGYEYEAGGTTQINFYSNFDFAFGYQEGDFDMNSKAKQDNPNDDTNFLYSQILFYPLNTGFRSNFDGFIEQLPQLPAADKYRCD